MNSSFLQCNYYIFLLSSSCFLGCQALLVIIANMSVFDSLSTMADFITIFHSNNFKVFILLLLCFKSEIKLKLNLGTTKINCDSCCLSQQSSRKRHCVCSRFLRQTSCFLPIHPHHCFSSLLLIQCFTNCESFRNVAMIWNKKTTTKNKHFCRLFVEQINQRKILVNYLTIPFLNFF